MKKITRFGVFALTAVLTFFSFVVLVGSDAVYAADMILWPAAPSVPLPFAPTPPPVVIESGGLAVWAIALIVVGAVAVLGGAGFAGFMFMKKRKAKNAELSAA